MYKVGDMNLYEVLEISHTASQAEIKKAYRRKALQYHPDKNPDNPKAAELFLELSKALEILTDDLAKAAYDKVLKAKVAAQLRHQELDDRRKKFKEELEAKERIFQASSQYKLFDFKSAEEKLAEEIDRLRRDGSKQLEQEMNFIKEQIIKEQLNAERQFSKDVSLYRLKVKWKSNPSDESNGGYNFNNLTQMFSKYGEIGVLIISQKKKGSALIEFDTPEAAVKAHQLEKGLACNPLKLIWLSGEPPMVKKSSPFDLGSGARIQATHWNKSKAAHLFPSFSSESESGWRPTASTKLDSEDDYEAIVLQKLREVQEKKNINNENVSGGSALGDIT